MRLKYGYYELRFKLASGGRNVASSFWIWKQVCPNNNPPDNMYNEIDFFEMNSATPFECPSSIHEGQYSCTNGTGYAYEYYDLGNPQNITNIDFSAAFHTIGVDWQPNHVDIFLDGVLYKHMAELNRNPALSSTMLTLYPDLTRPISDLYLPMEVVINGGITTRFLGKFDNPLPSGDIFEVDYFHYYKHRPMVMGASFWEEDPQHNIIDLHVNTGNPEDKYDWQILGNNITIIGPSNSNSIQLKFNPGYQETSIKVSATGLNPPATTSSILTFKETTGNLCNIPVGSFIYMSQDIIAPQIGCSSVIIASGTSVSFIANNQILLNPGFEVKLGGSFICTTH
jgi:hypothetical protein